MKNFLTSGIEAYRGYRSFAKRSKTYRAVNYSLTAIASAYCLLLLFPQLLFAHQISHKNFEVYTREPVSENIYSLLDAAEAKLLRSPIYKPEMKERLILTESFGLYKFLTVKGNSMGSTIPIVGHSRINRTDIDNDLVFRNSEPPNQRSLSGVIVHETMHNQIAEHLGFYRYMRTPAWKDEGYCEYVAGETTLSFDEGLRRWKGSPNDSSRYDYFKNHQMVKYLLEEEKVTVEELFTRSFDVADLAKKTLAHIDL